MTTFYSPPPVYQKGNIVYHNTAGQYTTTANPYYTHRDSYWKQSLFIRKQIDAELKRLGVQLTQMPPTHMQSMIDKFLKMFGDKHRDVNGNEIKLGDRIAAAVSGRQPSIQISIGIVQKLGKKKISYAPDTQTNASYLPKTRSIEPERCIIL